ncbi:predicted protein [Plenodomus lingam JN3]|uniref:Predicted protein n=1 Tax=Leptosphaeria maculans (strain JN3 / isolate v23.1.3 / race Av1-4-5-6-7-8) TaxID=985895 RepID=E5R4Z4_LEPMJ|nr:predicted protein [Plenodomus lingam JN3]CBX92267.1 predicted protein [Plenodomus lingam JN3]
MKMGQFPEPEAAAKASLHFLTILLMLIPLAHTTVASHIAQRDFDSHMDPWSSLDANDSSPLECLQVAPPVLSPAGGCQQTLMIHTFAQSYGQPFYSPPACGFNRITINFTVTSTGRQFDRLALMYLGDTEVFRTSTAEPTKNGIIWTYVKDMSAYLSLFSSPQKVIFDLGNAVNQNYTGLWDTTLTATFFSAKDDIHPADLIVPVSARRSADSAASAFIIPETRARNTFSLPQNMKKAVFSVSACGQAEEEFWWANVLTSDLNAFGNETTLYGHSAFREIQVLIDGHLAGVVWPFPIIFTGGVVPGFWRPIVGIDAFDLKEDEIDITPFIPMLSDGEDHSFEILVLGVEDDGYSDPTVQAVVGSNWIVTGKIFLWLDSDSSTAFGNPPIISAPKPSIKLQSTRKYGANGTVSSLDYSIEVNRNIYIESTMDILAGPETVYWKQDLVFANTATLSNKGNDQIVEQSTKGTDTASSSYVRTFSYPLQINSSYNAPAHGNVTINGSFDRAKISHQLSDLAFPNDYKTFDYYYARPAVASVPRLSGSNVHNWQKGMARYTSDPSANVKTSDSFGSTEQRCTLTGVGGTSIAVVQGDTGDGRTTSLGQTDELWERHMKATNSTIDFDEQRFSGQAEAEK